MTTRTRLLAVVLAALISTIGMASVAFAQDPCYPVPVEDCEVPTSPDTGVLPDADEDEDEDEPGAAVVPDQTSPGADVITAGQPVVQAQTALAQTGMPAAVLLAVMGLTLGSGVVLLLTTRRRAS